MNSQMTMAHALLSRVRQLRMEIGDHGDTHEETLVSGQVVPQLAVRVGEMLSHLRSALDRAAGGLIERVGGSQDANTVAFPIALRGVTQSDFRVSIRESMPRVLDGMPAALDLLESVQAFAGPSNAWLSDLGSVAADGCDVDLGIARSTVKLTDVTRSDGSLESLLATGGASNVGDVILVKNRATDGTSELEAFSVVVVRIDRELLAFLDECISGVDQIVTKLNDLKA